MTSSMYEKFQFFRFNWGGISINIRVALLFLPCFQGLLISCMISNIIVQFTSVLIILLYSAFAVFCKI